MLGSLFRSKIADRDAVVVLSVLHGADLGVVAEGVGGTEKIARQIQELTGIDTRATILGHVQRGGSPTVRDRVLATQLGYHAVELLEQGIGNRVVGIKEDKVVDFDIDEALEMHKPFEADLYQIADAVSI